MSRTQEELNYFDIKKELEQTVNNLKIPESYIQFHFERKEFYLQLKLNK